MIELIHESDRIHAKKKKKPWATRCTMRYDYDQEQKVYKE